MNIRPQDLLSHKPTLWFRRHQLFWFRCTIFLRLESPTKSLESAVWSRSHLVAVYMLWYSRLVSLSVQFLIHASSSIICMMPDAFLMGAASASECVLVEPSWKAPRSPERGSRYVYCAYIRKIPWDTDQWPQVCAPVASATMLALLFKQDKCIVSPQSVSAPTWNSHAVVLTRSFVNVSRSSPFVTLSVTKDLKNNIFGHKIRQKSALRSGILFASTKLIHTPIRLSFTLISMLGTYSRFVRKNKMLALGVSFFLFLSWLNFIYGWIETFFAQLWVL